MTVDRAMVKRVVVKTLAAECSCSEALFSGGETHVVELSPGRAVAPARRRFTIADPTIHIVSLGDGGVVSASAEWLPWARELFEGCDRDELFDPDRLGEAARRVRPGGARLYGPLPKFVCTSEDVLVPQIPDGYAVDVTGPEGVADLEPADWEYALPIRRRTHHWLVMAALASRGGEVAGVATVHAHSDMLWSIGINVAEGHRGRGLGVALTSTLGAAILERGCVPYYGTNAGNIPSMRTALAAGFKPAWVDAFSMRSGPA